MEALIQEEEYVLFLIEFEEDLKYSASFTIYKAIAWLSDTKEVTEHEKYLSGSIKWDGCSHLYFGDEEGYMYFCGKGSHDELKEVLDTVWDLCSKKIEGWQGD